MNFVTSVFKKYINKNEVKQPDNERPTNNADQLLSSKKSDAEKHPPVTSNSSTTGQIIDTKPIEEDETFQDAVTGSDSILDNEKARKNEQTFLANAQISDQSSAQPRVNRSSTAQNPQTPPSRKKEINKMQDSKTEIPQQAPNIQQRDSITFNITEPDSLNTSMVDSLEAPNADGLLPNHELSDSLEVLEYESSRESSTEPATFNAEDSNDYVSLSYILDDSIENSSSGNTILESSLNVKRSPLEMSGISIPKRNNSDEELATSKSEGALENLIRSVNETLVLSENAHQMNIEDPKEFNIVENLDELETENVLENTEQKETVVGLEPKENIPIKSDILLKNGAKETYVESELETAAEGSKTLTKGGPESELEPCTNESRKDSDESPIITSINVEDANMHTSLGDVKVVDPQCLPKPGTLENVCNVEKAEPKENTPQKEDAVPSIEEKREKVEAEPPEEISKEERIRIYERQETQELDHIIKKLEETTDTKSAANQENRVSFDRQDTQEFEKLERNFEENLASYHRQDTQEFENLERKCEGIAESSSSNTTDDILDILVANSQNPHDENGKPSDEEQRGTDKSEIVNLNKQLVEVNENHEKTKGNIEYQRQDTQEFENLERQYANNVLDQLVSKNNQDNGDKELNKNPGGSHHRSNFLLSMIEKPSEEINCTQNISNEAVADQENNLHFTEENSASQMEPISNKNAESIKNGRDERLNYSEADINPGAKPSLNEAKPTTEDRRMVQASQNIEHSEIETVAKNETIQSSKSELEEQNKNATTDVAQSVKPEENIAGVNGSDGTLDGLKTSTHKGGKFTNKKNAQRKKSAKKHFPNSLASDSNDAQDINNRVNNQNKLEEKCEAELTQPGLEPSEDQRNGNKSEALNISEKSAEEMKLISTQSNSVANNETRNGIDLEQDSIKSANKKNTLKITNSSNEINNYKKLLEQYEKRILEQNTELEKLKTELSTNFRHFNNTEMAFSDLFEKYEKAKSVITLYKQNEDILVENIENAEGQLSQLESKCATMKRQSLEQIRRAQQETEDEKQRYRRDLSNLQAQVKRLEIKAASLEIELVQKTEECQALANLCDEITGRQ